MKKPCWKFEDDSGYPIEMFRLRKSLRLSRAAFARKLEIPETTLRRWEKGDCNPLAVYQEKIKRFARRQRKYDTT